VQRELLARNPFDGIQGTVGSNRERDYFIDRDTTAKVLEACPDAQWRLLFALSRFGGLRCPSEHLALTWADVNWAESRMLVRSAKTEHHEGKGTRLVPIFPELRPYLEQVWDEAEPGTVHVITRYRADNANLRTQLERIIRKAGLESWPKLFQNLRASRATELASEHPAHVAAAWLGHSILVANKHYWQVTDADFTKATGDGAKAAQNPAQRAHADSGKESHATEAAHEKAPVLLGSATLGDNPQNGGMGGTGLEPVTSTV
jgi:integrase